MRTCLKVILPLLLILLAASVLVSDDSGAATSGPVIITEVNPYDEAVTLRNIGDSTLNLKDYLVTDGEGKLTFTSSYKLAPGETVTLSKAQGTDWFNSRQGVITFTNSCITKSGSFVLADSGDEVMLFKGSRLVDSVCYGKSGGCDGWSGPAVQNGSKHYLTRVGSADTNLSNDWVSIKPGWTLLGYDPGHPFDASVSPFTFPESEGIPILNTLSAARHSIDISLYLLSSPKVVSILCQKEREGVEVRVLMEGSPLGVDISTELSLMKSLADCGGEVRIINYSGASDCRYTYVHNKYAVVDSDTVIITSENWTAGNISEFGNRGWGAVIRSSDYATYMRAVFENDFSMMWSDVKDLLSIYPNVKPYSGLKTEAVDEYALYTYSATICPIVSPDDSYAALEAVIGGASERLYVEQMDLGSSMSQVTGSTPVVWMSSASSRGVDTKYILDASQSSASTHESYVKMITSATGIQAITVNGGKNFSLIHNKGIIADDSVWVGSVNWTDTSFRYNRESAVLINSREVSDYFAAFFLSDFGVNLYTVEQDGLLLSVSLVDTPQGEKVLLSVSGPTGYEYEWDLGNGESRVTQNNMVMFDAPSSGTYSASVCLVDTGMSSSAEYTVQSDDEGGGSFGLVRMMAVVAAASVLALGILAAVIHERRERARRRMRHYRRGGFRRP